MRFDLNPDETVAWQVVDRSDESELQTGGDDCE